MVGEREGQEGGGEEADLYKNTARPEAHGDGVKR
jgi:hypothetical protein